MPTKDCIQAVKAATKNKELTNEQASKLLKDIQRRALERKATKRIQLSKAMQEIALEDIEKAKSAAAKARAGIKLQMIAVQNLKNYIGNSKLGTIDSIREYLQNIDFNKGHIEKAGWAKVLAEVKAEGHLEQLVDILDKDTPEAHAMAEKLAIELERLKDPTIKPSGSEAAASIAKSFRGVQDMFLARMRRAGADVPHQKMHVLHRVVSPEKIKRYGRTGLASWGKSDQKLSYAWFRRKLDEEGLFEDIDWERVPLEEGQTKEQFLEGYHSSLYSGVYGISDKGSVIDEYSPPFGSTAKKAEAQRLLWFKTPQSEAKIWQLIGVPPADAMRRTIQTQARAIALMEALGPNSEKGLRDVLRWAAERDKRKMGFGEGKDYSLDSGALAHDWAVITGETSTIRGNAWLAKMVDTYKNWQVTVKLPKAFLSSFADVAMFNNALARQGLKGADLWAASLMSTLPKGAEGKAVLEGYGIIADVFAAETASRFVGETGLSRASKKLANFIMKWSGLEGWTLNRETGTVVTMAHLLGSEKKLGWNELPQFRREYLARHDITETQWEAVRQIDSRGISDRPVLVLDDVNKITDEGWEKHLASIGHKNTPSNRSRARDKLRSALAAYIESVVVDATPRPGMFERSFMTRGLPRGDVFREALELFWTFKGFGMSALMRRGRMLKFEQGNYMPKLWLINLAVQASIAGYVSMTVRDLLDGRSRRSLWNEEKNRPEIKVWLEAMARGGAYGILTDLMLQEYDNQLHSLPNVLAGPAWGDMSKMATLALTAARGGLGQEVKGEALLYQAERLAEANAPVLGLWYIAPLINHFFWYNLRESLSPGTLRRTERAVERDGTQRVLIRPSQSAQVPAGQKMNWLLEQYLSEDYLKESLKGE